MRSLGPPLILPRRGVIKPARPHLDRTHPLSKGLIACLYPTGTGNLFVDLCGKYFGTITDGPANPWARAPYGGLAGALRGPGNFDRILAPSLSGIVLTRASVVMLMRLTTTTSSGTDPNYSWFWNASSAESHYPYLDDNIYDGTLSANRKDVGAGLIARADLANWHQVAITTSPGGGNWKFYQNAGLCHANTGDASITLGSTVIGGRAAGGPGDALPSEFDIIRVYEVELSQGDLAWLRSEPYAGIEDGLYDLVGVAAVGGGLSIPIAYHHYRTMHAA